ncbi:hypothetical protein WR25_15844 [Diploscapter pachys]|uniref:Uncharacterized protein n=1 Tax=Diploscapter pachys TaxID=2018661 RepID=A0A2A2J7U3_9BILA|nr:hypothetical protein WR25_15844 [Diploscapter pachys]
MLSTKEKVKILLGSDKDLPEHLRFMMREDPGDAKANLDENPVMKDSESMTKEEKKMAKLAEKQRKKELKLIKAMADEEKRRKAEEFERANPKINDQTKSVKRKSIF